MSASREASSTSLEAWFTKFIPPLPLFSLYCSRLDSRCSFCLAFACDARSELSLRLGFFYEFSFVITLQPQSLLAFVLVPPLFPHASHGDELRLDPMSWIGSPFSSGNRIFQYHKTLPPRSEISFFGTVSALSFGRRAVVSLCERFFPSAVPFLFSTFL